MSSNFDDLLLNTFDDQHLSRSEKQLLQQVLYETQADENKLAQYRNKAFEIARESLPNEESKKVLKWLENVVKALQKHSTGNSAVVETETCFTPGDKCSLRIEQLFSLARTSADVCVFTITDNRVYYAMKEAHDRGVKVRVITDDEKLHDAGSDIRKLKSDGVPIKVDESEYHMHHKFAIFDGKKLLSGSYNWTRGAAENNHENFLITTEPKLVHEYAAEFEKLWKKFPSF